MSVGDAGEDAGQNSSAAFERRSRLEDAQKRRITEDARLRGHIDNVLRTESGRALFAYLFKDCGYNQSSIIVNPNSMELNLTSTAHNEARRSVYVRLRKKASASLLHPAEELAESGMTEEKH